MFIYLVLTILFGSAFGLCIKWVQIRKKEDVITVGLINYVVALIISLPLILGWLQSEPTGDRLGSKSAVDVQSEDIADDQLVRVFRTESFAVNLFGRSLSGEQVIAGLCGAMMGVAYFAAYFFVDYSIRNVGVATTAVVGTLSMIVPIATGIFIWDESPNTWQLVGIAMAIFALTLVGTRSAESDRNVKFNWVTPMILLSFFALAGISRLSQETFKHESVAEYRSSFLFVAFLVASIPSLIMLIWRRKIPGLYEVGFGILMGASNILQTQFILMALKGIDGFIVFPVVSAGGLLLTTFVAHYWLDDRIDARTTWGVGLAIIALILLNAGPQIQIWIGSILGY